MLKIIQDEGTIRKCQRQFTRSFKSYVDETIPVHLGHPGASIAAKVLWSNHLGIWLFSGRTEGNRYWNAFGAIKPRINTHVPITCEINFPVSGIDRRIGGALARDRKGRIFIVHRGKIGGGKKGIGKSLFSDHYRGVWEITEDGEEETTMAVISALHSPRLVRQVAQFIHKIDKIKETASHRSPQTEMKFEAITFRETLVGERYCDQEKNKDSECDHGLVVKDLADTLRRQGLKVGNDGLHDLFIANDNGKITEAFQIRTTCTPLTLHAGAARLLLNSLRCAPPPRLILVTPEKPESGLALKLKDLNISILSYTWDKDQARFPDLRILLKNLPAEAED